MKIIIVGGGIAGLSTYLHLRKYMPNSSSHTIQIYESHRPHAKPLNGQFSSQTTTTPLNVDTLSESTAIVGGGLGVSPNGMRILRDLSIELHDRVVAQGFPVEHFIFKSANGWTLGVQKTSDKAVRKEREEEEICIASSRHGLWETLMRFVEEEEGRDVVRYRKVISVERGEKRSENIIVRSVDEQGKEEIEKADLVIGADGVKSVVRKALFGEEAKLSPAYS